jgi:type IV secretory pathway VirD2 relaxase
MCVFRSHLWLRHRFLRRRSSLNKNEYGVAAAAVCRRKAHYLATGNALAALMRKQLKTRQPPKTAQLEYKSYSKTFFGYELSMQ